MLHRERLTKSSIKRLVEQHPDFSDLLTIRDTENTLIQLRFFKNGKRASWRFLYKNKWIKVAEYPEVGVSDIRDQFGSLMADLRSGKDASVVVDRFVLCADLFEWCLARVDKNSLIKDQTKKDIRCAITRHLLPLIGSVQIDSVNKDLLSELFIWPLQERLKYNSVHKVFHITKRLFRDAVDLDRLGVNPLGDIKFSDFNLTKDKPKEALLKPYQVGELLSNLSEAKPVLVVLVLTMLTLGTRIGETLKAKWRNFGFADTSVWDIPSVNTKTGKEHSIVLPKVYVDFLTSWRLYLSACYYNGPYVFPNTDFDGALQYNDAAKMVRELSKGEWSSHDLRGCARKCWDLQGVDFMVGERMLNHSLGKVAEAYLDKGNQASRLKALSVHCDWLLAQNANCFYLNPHSTLSSNDDFVCDSSNGAYG